MSHAQTRERLARRFFRIAVRGAAASGRGIVAPLYGFYDCSARTQDGWRHLAEHALMRGYLVLSPP